MVQDNTVRMITNSNWAAVYLNLHKARQQLGMIVRVLEITGATVRDWGEM